MKIYKVEFNDSYYPDNKQSFEIYNEILKDHSNKYQLYEIQMIDNKIIFLCLDKRPSKIYKFKYKRGLDIFFY